MAEGSESSRRDRLRDDFHCQTAKITFAELQRYFAAGKLIQVGSELDLVEVAVELALDNRQRFEEWTAAGAVAPVNDDQARRWLESDRVLWAVVADPWVLVQDR